MCAGVPRPCRGAALAGATGKVGAWVLVAFLGLLLVAPCVRVVRASCTNRTLDTGGTAHLFNVDFCGGNLSDGGSVSPWEYRVGTGGCAPADVSHGLGAECENTEVSQDFNIVGTQLTPGQLCFTGSSSGGEFLVTDLSSGDILHDGGFPGSIPCMGPGHRSYRQ